MKKKFILPIIALGLFAACSDDSNSAAPTTDPVVDSALAPADSAAVNLADNPANSTTTDPAQGANEPATNPSGDSVSTDTTANSGTGESAAFDPSASVTACRNAARTIVDPTYAVVPTFRWN